MAKIKRIRNFVEIDFLDDILKAVKDYLPSNLKYIRIYNETVGFQQGSLELTYFTSNFSLINLDKQFNDNEKDIYGGEECLSDFIHNSLIGMVHNCNLIDWKKCDEFFDKVQNDTEYFYECKTSTKKFYYK